METQIKTNPQDTMVNRLLQYQKERFPILQHGILIASFSFSAISYSRICRGAVGFIPWLDFLAGIIITTGLFFLVRIFDEFKDAEEDAALRPQLPVPRGLVSLRELAWCGIASFIIQVAVIVLAFPKMLLLYIPVLLYLCLMGKEFFISGWLKKHQFWYVVSHMFIIPLVDVFASGLDWFLEGEEAPTGLLFFFAVSYMNGIVLEIGRKIRAGENEEHNTYSTLLGRQKATRLWLLILVLTFLLSLTACWFAGYGLTGFMVLGVILVICAFPGFLFLKKQSVKNSKLIEVSSGVWTIAMYMTLGAIPMLSRILQ